MELHKGSLGQSLVVSGLVNLIDNEGHTFHEAMEVLEQIKRDIFPALLEMSREKRDEK